jgi:hypothetical protein
MVYKRIPMLVILILLLLSLAASAASVGTSTKQPVKPPDIAEAKIMIVSPQGGQVLRVGEQAVISWNYTGNIGGPPFIRLIHHAGDPAGHGLFDVVINSQVLVGNGGHGSLNWGVPEIPTGYTYSIDIGSPHTGASSQKFTIINPKQQPTIKIAAPNGGEVWHKGKTYNITWTHVADPGQKVIITLVPSSDPAKFRKLGEALAGANGSGSFSWKVPADVELGKDYKIWLANGAYHKNFIDSSDNNFTIAAPLMVKPADTDITKTPVKPNPGDKDKLDPQPEPPMKNVR